MVTMIAILLSGCVVFSFYPLYTEKDLFPNDILTGEWFENDDQEATFNQGEDVWNFVHPYLDEEKKTERDSCAYVLTLTGTENGRNNFV